ncbi:M23 family metallopeptidase [Chlorogloeopsis sp. ULAP02]|uniref:M23 family metallopeptidase n=1 Tax=Chlorogloeopsis sp. ULAP02 TaxID=3107926 RepID=UPI003136812F
MITHSLWPWRRFVSLAIAIIVLAIVAGIQIASGSQPTQSNNQWTPLVVSTLMPKTNAVLGVDGKYHVVYELQLSNSNPTTATLKTIEVLDASAPSRVIFTYAGRDLLGRLRTLGNSPASSPDIEFNGTRLFLIDLAFNSRMDLPSRLLHRFNLLGGSSPVPTPPSPLNYTAAPFTLTPQTPVFGPPLAGKGWVAINGCCAPNVGHRSTGLPIDGQIYFAQRFAIDWMQLDDQGRVVKGDVKNLSNFPSYGADVLAIADGTVVETLNTLSEQIPPSLPDPSTITLENLLGNHVILRLSPNVFALYAHLQKNSVTVKSGERVRRGQVLGKLGNTGNSSAPHLHLHLMSGSSLGSDGLPYVINRFSVAGQIPAEATDAFYELKGDWRKYLLSNPSSRRDQFPLHFTIVDFPD